MRKLLLLFPAILLSCVPSYAALLGTPVTGSLQFSAGSANFFDPVYGFVPSGYSNSSGITVAVSGSAVEFGFDDGANRFTVNFTDDQVTISDLVESSGSNLPFTMTFTDSAFSGQSVAALSNAFPLTYSLSGSVLTVRGTGGTVAAGQTLTGSLSITPAPEPSTIGLLLVSGLFVFSLTRRE